MSFAKVFYLFSSLLLLTAAFIIFSPTLISPELINPVRIDSLYITLQKPQASNSQDSSDNNSTLFFNPSDVNLRYENFDVITTGKQTLRGWFVGCDDSTANTLVVVHDLNESKIKYINFIRQMHDRGLNVCVVDMRAHGSSDGFEFSPGIIAVSDMKNILDSLFVKLQTKRIAVFGAGVGAAIAIQAAANDNRIEAVIAQSPFNNYERYVNSYAHLHWRFINRILLPVIKRKIENQLQCRLNELDIVGISSYVKIPSLFIAGADDALTNQMETASVYEASATEEKNLILVNHANHDNIETIGGEEYYNRISEFIVKAMPKKTKVVRNKKLT